MKRNLLLICFAFALCFTGVTYAQTEQEIQRITSGYDYSKASSFLREVQSFTKNNYNEAKRIAELTDQPLTMKLDDGGYAALRGVSKEGHLLYVRTFNKNGLSVINADVLHTGGKSGLNLDGDGMRVGVWDGGAVRISHELFEGRAKLIDYSPDLSDHANHVTGTIIGSGGVRKGEAKGAAHKAKADTYDWTDDYPEMIAAAKKGLLLSNHSYGLMAVDKSNRPLLPRYYFGQYIEGSQIVDQIASDFEYYLIVFAAGNDRDKFGIINSDKLGYDLLSNEGISKNNLVVASIADRVGYGLTDSPISSYSNYGPTDDGRIKPDIAARGDRIISAVGESDNSYGYMSGTSMASPFVTGGLALLQEHSNNVFDSYLRSATLRALVLHSAIKAGVEGSPNYRYGWGVMNLERAATVMSNNRKGHLLKELRLEQGDSYLLTLSASKSENLVGTIAWTDLPGKVAGNLQTNLDNRTPLLVHDLDLRITQAGKTYYPFVLNPEVPELPATTGDNFRDNVEKIEIADASGEYNVAITHKGDLQTDSQRLGLVLSGISDMPLYLETYENNRSVCKNSSQLTIKLLLSATNNIDKTVLSIGKAPKGVKASLDTSSLATGVVYLNIDGLTSLAAGDYTIEVLAKNDSDEAKIVPTFSIVNVSGETVQLLEPKNKQEEVGETAKFSWKPVGSGKVESYTLEIASDKDFKNIVDVVRNIKETNYEYSSIKYGQDYFWRVKAVGDCGEGAYSDVFSFYSYNILSVEDYNESKLSIHPNPSSSIVHINAPRVIKHLRILNMLGQEVMKVTPDYNSGQVEIDISSLSSGSYLLQISDGTTTEVKRLIRK